MSDRPAFRTRSAEAIVTQIRDDLAQWKGTIHRMGAGALLKDINLTGEAFHQRAREIKKSTDRQSFGQLMIMIKDALLVERWVKYREVYEVHPAVSQALNDAKLDTVVPGQLFRQLRHINPLFVFTTAIDVPLSNGDRGRVIGMLLTGTRNSDDGTPGTLVMDTHRPKADGVRAMMFTEVLSDDGARVVDSEVGTFSIRFDTNGSLRELIDRVVDHEYTWDQGTIRWEQKTEAEEQKRTALGRLITIAVVHLTYAVSASFDAEDRTRADRPPAAAKAAAAGRKPAKPAKIRKVGFRDGAAIEDTLRRREAMRTSTGTGRTVVPHMRAAHPHLYWTGKGREIPVIKWLLPTLVNAASDDGSVTTLHPVNPRSAT